MNATVHSWGKASVPAKGSLWSALAEFDVKLECRVDFLAGSRGGYVHAFASASTSLEFADRVGLALKRLDLIPQKLEEIEEIEDPDALSEKWTALCSEAKSSGEVVFGEFFLYDIDEDAIVQ